ncbi:hypothetical protein FJV41_32775 [Myxococcus llanfairpwllgwyngyllgogerychwyrndrobwllllantysiliogogogochensis]|uniref:Uncharacterized protein n=1 Tax=Myxococcus llanfairpwllgwyngyllgogerychwyrndrobwllllantysiliogogogochensis TaxID=2590453 RepID=A0A540WTG1_9BACT|nr:hypothetical protein [Myxococcus llanfairpwllgwyngyllgogerychwyrndrobwllllantysiliogogogochensis]TQF11724.1 hypothetical protein FJV41_32775 [Myxococcus llanfairpwllgwyngyllgogerychwyrndrobwllllantysiliogogogochensis]
MNVPPAAALLLLVWLFDAAKVAIEATGGQVLNGPNEIPGGDFSMNGVDPQGAEFALVGARKG